MTDALFIPHPATPPPSDHDHGNPLQNALSALYRGSPWLTVAGTLLLVDTVFCIAGLTLDRTVITGAPAWIKPLKFALSTAFFCFTLAYILGLLQKTRRFASVLGRLTAASLIAEIALIDLQAARHTTSHFNVGNAFDRGVFSIMGAGIAVVTLCTLMLLVATFLDRFPDRFPDRYPDRLPDRFPDSAPDRVSHRGSDRAQGYAIRLGLVFALAGMFTGVLMTLPTPDQLALVHRGGGMPLSGAHTVGAPDGGRLSPLTGWSADHGDLRIAHFVGLHGMQVLLLVWWASRRAGWSSNGRSRLLLATAASYAVAFGALLAQALRGQPLLSPDPSILAVWVAWLATSAVVLGWIVYTEVFASRHLAMASRIEESL